MYHKTLINCQKNSFCHLKNFKDFLLQNCATRTQFKIANIQPEFFKINLTRNLTIKRSTNCIQNVYILKILMIITRKAFR